MSDVVYSEESIFHLSRLSSVVAGKMGRRFHLQDEEDLNSLIKISDSSRDPRIAQRLQAFVTVTEPYIIEKLEGQGLIRPGKYLH